MPWDGIAFNHSSENTHHLTLARSRSSSIPHSQFVPSAFNSSSGPSPPAPSPPAPLPIPEISTPPSESDDTLHSATDQPSNPPQQRASSKSEKSTQADRESGLPAFEKGNHDGNQDPFLVTYEGREHMNPHNWSSSYRWFLTAFAGLLVLNATFASSAPSNLIPSIILHYGVSSEVGTLLIAIFVAGYCIGPLLWGPLSERYGRKNVFLVAFLPYTGFQVGCALSPNIGSLLAFRFLGGCFAASPLTNSGGVIADLWDADRRGIALALFALAPFAGPAIAPVISGAMEVTNTDFRWIFWVLTIFAGVCFILIFFCLPETYTPYILQKEARRLRKETGDERYYSSLDTQQKSETWSIILSRTIFKPFKMISQEPMLLAVTLYMSFVYGIVYLLFEAIPIIGGEQHDLNALEVGLIFIPLPVGGALAVALYIVYFNRKYMTLHHSLKPRAVPPEIRLQPIMVAAFALVIGIFWMGWTAFSSISIWSTVIAVGVIGFSVLLIFLGGFNYLLDAYLMNAASALAINTVVRSAFGAGFPMFATQMFRKLTVQGASSLLGGLAIVFVPIPFVLYKYGKKIRGMSKNAVVGQAEAEL